MYSYGITDEQIEANAMHIRSPGLQMLDRMVTSRETLRNGTIKEHERLQEKGRKRRTSPSGRRSMSNAVREAKSLPFAGLRIR